MKKKPLNPLVNFVLESLDSLGRAIKATVLRGAVVVLQIKNISTIEDRGRRIQI